MAESTQNFSLSEIYVEPLRFQSGREGFAHFGGRPAARPHSMHRHAELEFNLVTSGTARYLVASTDTNGNRTLRRHDLRPGSLIWLFPEHDHILLDRSPDYYHWCVVFRPERVQQTCPTDTFTILREPNPIGDFCRTLSLTDTERLATHLATFGATEHPEFLNAGLSFTLLWAWQLFLAVETTGKKTALHPAVAQAVAVIRNEETTTPLPEIAAQTGFSTGHLSKLFQAQTGMSLTTFRNRERIKRFCDRYGHGLQETALTCALAVGFGSYASFHRVFKSVLGISLRQWRRPPAGTSARDD